MNISGESGRNFIRRKPAAVGGARGAGCAGGEVPARVLPGLPLVIPVEAQLRKLGGNLAGDFGFHFHEDETPVTAVLGVGRDDRVTSCSTTCKRVENKRVWMRKCLNEFLHERGRLRKIEGLSVSELPSVRLYPAVCRWIR